jgi:hypothetical protein
MLVVGFLSAKLVLEPIFEADFEDNVYGYRPVRGAVDAVKEVRRLIGRATPTWSTPIIGGNSAGPTYAREVIYRPQHWLLY